MSIYQVLLSIVDRHLLSIVDRHLFCHCWLPPTLFFSLATCSVGVMFFSLAACSVGGIFYSLLFLR
ncbi:hypothetical protein RHGRI_011085 [Rhododendron griersonianum]|uniref:Uncharacterized protein n=1 Tax=Rhododendron griersonianum TaxID=479676 RepID=A0AAV6KL60_9ERIC|nr:hypothetical protein RHGRI_011085 [Rhododendron griersonianum]